MRARAFEANAAHFADVFRSGRAEYAIPAGALSDEAKLRQLAAFFFWTSWAASTNRPDDSITYTSNWPHEPLVGNVPTGEAVVWTGVSIIMLLAGIAGMVWYYASRGEQPAPGPIPTGDPLLGYQSTPSQRATVKYFWTVAALFLVQILLGVVVAHYGVEGDGFYGIPPSRRSSPTASPGPGTCSWASSGSPRRGWRRASTSGRPWAAWNRRASASA